MSSRILRSLPRIPVPIGHKPQKLKFPLFPHAQSRLEVLRKIVTKLMREERIELYWNRALETRPYMERLLQLAIERGIDDEYTMEMCSWWIMEKDLIRRLFEVYVPRFKPYCSPYTRLYRLPTQRIMTNKNEMGMEFWKEIDVSLLELKGNPFPPVVPVLENHKHSLLNVLLSQEAKRRAQASEENCRVIDSVLKSQSELESS